MRELARIGMAAVLTVAASALLSLAACDASPRSGSMDALDATAATDSAAASASNAAPPATAAPFRAGAAVGELAAEEMREASGLVASSRHPGIFWLHNDSGDEARLFAVDSSGALRATLRVAGARNRDWEDIARRGDTLFVADIGDNEATHGELRVHAVPEPAALHDGLARVAATYRLRYPDGARDAEAFLIDPRSGDWYIVTKRESAVHLYRATAPQLPDSLRTLERIVGTLPFRAVTAGDVSADGGEVLVKSYEAVFYWRREGDESLAQTLMRPPTLLPYVPEPQGEAIAFALDGSAYLTTTERSGRGGQPLLRYPRAGAPRP